MISKAIQIAYNELFEKKCEFAHEAGFKHISVNFDGIKGKSSAEWDSYADDILRIFDRYDLKAVQTHLSYYDLRLSSDVVYDDMEEAMKQSVKVSGLIGAPWCVVHPRTSISSGYITERSIEDNVKYVNSYLEAAEKYNTGIALENLPIFRGIVPCMAFFSSNFTDLRELADTFKSDRVSICWDTGHANMMDFDQSLAIRHLGSRIKCTHIHNNFKTDDNHLPPDNGNIDWPKVMAAFTEIGYTGPLTLETHCCYVTDALLRSFAKYNYICLEYLEELMG